MIGLPASGKSTWARQHYSHFTILNGDSLKTSPKVVKALSAALQRGESVVVDATNATLERRRDIVAEARKFNVQIWGLVFRFPMDVCMERAKMREAAGGPHIPRIAFYTFNKRYVEPALQEGFDRIEEIKMEN